jgi:hypothetical protein
MINKKQLALLSVAMVSSFFCCIGSLNAGNARITLFIDEQCQKSKMCRKSHGAAENFVLVPSSQC